MMYRIVWKRDAVRELAAITVAASNRGAITTAVNVAERTLMRDPLNSGKAFGRRIRRCFVTPLTVEYAVNGARAEVTITGVLWGDKTS